MERPQRTTTVIIAGLAILGSLVSIWFGSRPVQVIVDQAPIIASYTGLGEVLTEETVKAVHDQGRIVVVTGYDHEGSARRRDECWETFHNELKKHGNVRIVATEILPPDSNEGSPPSFSRTAFKALLERHAEIDVFVFFCDLPVWSGVESLIPKPITSKFIAVDNLGPLTKVHYGGYFSSGILLTLIGTSRKSMPASQPKTPREWFDRYYQVYTPQNYELLPE